MILASKEFKHIKASSPEIAELFNKAITICAYKSLGGQRSYIEYLLHNIYSYIDLAGSKEANKSIPHIIEDFIYKLTGESLEEAYITTSKLYDIELEKNRAYWRVWEVANPNHLVKKANIEALNFIASLK